MFRSKWIYLLAAMIPVALMAAVAKDYRIVQDRFILGTPSGPDPVIKFQGTTATIKANRTSNTIEFADDGATFKSIGSPVPTQQKFLSGSGTYTTPAGVKWIKVRMAGGGGGGAGGGVNGTAGNAVSGTNTTFGTLIAGAGSLANAGGSPGGPGGTNTFSGTGFELDGGRGDDHMYYTNGGFDIGGGGGRGGVNPFGGAGGAGSAGGGPAVGHPGTPNTGAGGGGGGAGSSGASLMRSGSGGGAGGYIEAIIEAPAATYSYAVGSGGAGGTGGTSGGAGGAGGSGIIIVKEFY